MHYLWRQNRQTCLIVGPETRTGFFAPSWQVRAASPKASPKMKAVQGFRKYFTAKCRVHAAVIVQVEPEPTAWKVQRFVRRTRSHRRSFIRDAFRSNGSELCLRGADLPSHLFQPLHELGDVVVDLFMHPVQTNTATFKTTTVNFFTHRNFCPSLKTNDKNHFIFVIHTYTVATHTVCTMRLRLHKKKIYYRLGTGYTTQTGQTPRPTVFRTIYSAITRIVFAMIAVVCIPFICRARSQLLQCFVGTTHAVVTTKQTPRVC